MGSIRMLANAIDEKDPYTRGHSERVAYYSACVAKHLGMSPEEVERVHLSGIIHDVGKIGIEDKILRKAAALTDDEYEIMKQHPTQGGAHPGRGAAAQGDGGRRAHASRERGRQRLPRRPQGRGHPAPRAHRERGRRLRRHDHRPALLEGDDLRGGHRPTALPGGQEVRRRLRRGLRAASGAGDVSPAKARRASVASRRTSTGKRAHRRRADPSADARGRAPEAPVPHG